MNLGQKISQIRLEKNITQVELAKTIGISTRTLISYETLEDSNLSVNILNKICDALDVSILSFFDINPALQYVPNKTISLFVEAYKLDYNFEKLDEILINYIFETYVKTKFKSIKRSEKLFDKLFFNDIQRLGYTRILIRAFEQAIKNKRTITITIENSKKILIEIIHDYKLRLLQDTVNNHIYESTKEEFTRWIKDSLEDIECFVILNDFEKSIEELKDTLSFVERITS